LDEPAYANARARAANREAVIARLSALTTTMTKAELQDRLGGVVPFGPVLSIGEIAHDGHFAARDMLAEIDIEGFPEPMRVAGQPIKFARTPSGVRSRGPLLGEHTDAVLRAHGITDDEIARWRAAGVIGEEPA